MQLREEEASVPCLNLRPISATSRATVKERSWSNNLNHSQSKCDLILTFVSTSTCSDESEAGDKKLIGGEPMSPFSITASPTLSELSEIKEGEEKLQFENNKFKGGNITC